MKRTAYYFWIYPNPKPGGKPLKTRYRMTLEQGREAHPDGGPDESSVEWRDIAETEEEIKRAMNQRGDR